MIPFDHDEQVLVHVHVHSEQIADELKKICGAIFTENEAAHQQCNNVVDTYLPQLINMLVNEYLSPDEVCLALTACP